MLTTKNWLASSALLGLALLGATVLTACRPAGPKALLEGESLIRAGKYPQAIQKLQVATQLLPSNAQAWNHLGLAYHHAHQPGAALKAYQQARRCDANLTPVRYNLGCLLLEQNNPQGAVAELTGFTVLQRDSTEGWVKLGTAQLRAHQQDAAERSFQEALRLRPDLVEAWNDLGIAQTQRRRPKEALISFTTALQKQPNYAPALLNVAVLHQQYLNNRALALQKYQDYLELDPVPREAAAVQEIVRQLRAELMPPPRRELTNALVVLPSPPTPTLPNVASSPRTVTATNLTRAVSNAPTSAISLASTNRARSVATNVVTLAEPSSPPKTLAEPPRKVEIPTALAPQPATNEAKPVLPPKVEVVQLADEPPPQVAQDTAVGRSDTPPPGAVPSTVGQEQPSTLVVKRPQDSAQTQTSPAEKRRALDRLNPTTWFRGKKRAGSTPTPLEPSPDSKATVAPSDQTEARPRSIPAVSAPAASPLPEPVVVGRRYAYVSQPKTPPGERRKAEAFFARGVQLQQDGRLEEALVNYRQAIKLDPRYFEAHYNRGLAAYQLEDLPQSLAAYETALSINPTSSNARYNFAVALEQGEYYQDAANELERLIELHPGEVRAHFSLASLYAQKLFKPELARPHYRTVLELDPQHPRASDIRFWLAANP